MVASTNRLTRPLQPPPQRDHRPLHNAAPVPSNYVIFLVSDNDVLLGRGAPLAKFIGNVRFRTLICLHKQKYNGTNRQRIKRHIANEVRQEIQRRGGRFLVPLFPTEKARYHVSPNTRQAWVQLVKWLSWTRSCKHCGLQESRHLRHSKCTIPSLLKRRQPCQLLLMPAGKRRCRLYLLLVHTHTIHLSCR
jgi:hypothetical protein